jgi:hypothetical protein
MHLLVPLFPETTPHVPIPRRGTVRRESDGKALAFPAEADDFPILATCASCESGVRRETDTPGKWEHVPAAEGLL